MKRVKMQAALITVLMMVFTCLPAAGSAAEISGDPTGQETDAEQLLTAKDAEGRMVSLTEIDENDYNGFIYVLKESVTEEQIEEIENNIEDIDDEAVAEEISEGQIYAAESLDVIEQVADPSAIEYIEPNYLVSIAYIADPFDRYNGTMLNTIQIKDVWNSGVTGTGQNGADTPVVAVMDTGLMGVKDKSKRHEDLDYSRIPYAWKGKFSSAEDANGHGTFVAGEILATMDNRKGVSGMMPKVKLIPVRVLNKKGQGETKDIISAMNYLVKKNDADVINMSFGSAYHSAAFEKACKKATQKGMILVAAAGNDGNPAFKYPAGYPGVIGVAAVKGNGGKWKYSEYNDSVDVAAPGVNVAGLSDYSTRSYTQMSGTSMATPIVTALAAMVKSIDPTVNHNKFLSVLKSTSKDIGKKGYDVHYGMGIINFAKAYQYVSENKGRIRTVTVKKSQKPKKGKIKTLKRTKTSVTIKAKKLKKTTSYQVAIKKKGKKYSKIRFSKNKFKIINLQRHTTYYIKVRGVHNVNGIMVYGKWSKVKKFRTK